MMCMRTNFFLFFDMSIIDNYVKNSNDINSLQVEEPCFSKSKSYLKIIGIPFFPHTNSQEKLTSNDIEMILKQNHIFDNISLVKIVDGGLYFIFSFPFYFTLLFFFFFIFLFLEQLELGFISHAVTSVTN